MLVYGYTRLQVSRVTFFHVFADAETYIKVEVDQSKEQSFCVALNQSECTLQVYWKVARWRARVKVSNIYVGRRYKGPLEHFNK